MYLLFRFAASRGVHLYTFDSEYELQKMAKLDPTAKLLVRIKVDNPKSVEFEVHCAIDAQIVRSNDSTPHL